MTLGGQHHAQLCVHTCWRTPLQVRISYMRRILTMEGEVTFVGQRLEFQDPPGVAAAPPASAALTSTPRLLQAANLCMPPSRAVPG